MTRPPGWLLAVTAPLRREPSAAWSAVRLGLYAAAVLTVLCWGLLSGAPWWVACVLAAVPAVLLSPVALLAQDRLRQGPRGDDAPRRDSH